MVFILTMTQSKLFINNFMLFKVNLLINFARKAPRIKRFSTFV